MDRLTKFVTPVGLVMTSLNSMKHYMPCVVCRHNAKIKYDSNGNGYTEKFGFCDTCEVKMLFNKLKAYEDAEEQGLLLRLPCKVGDTVYINCPSWAGKFAGTQPHQITNILISQNKKGKWTKKYRAILLYNGKTIDRQEDFEFDEIGKTVFLTREEAEVKLKELGE